MTSDPAIAFARFFLVVAALLGVLGLSLGVRLVIDWLADAAGYPFPPKRD